MYILKIDTLDIVAHDHYRELVDEIKNSDIFRYHDLDTQSSDNTESVDVTASASDDQLSLFDDATKIVTGSFLITVTILLFLSLMTLPSGNVFSIR